MIESMTPKLSLHIKIQVNTAVGFQHVGVAVLSLHIKIQVTTQSSLSCE